MSPTFEIYTLPSATGPALTARDSHVIKNALACSHDFFLWRNKIVNAVGVPTKLQDRVQVSDQESSATMVANKIQVEAIQALASVILKQTQGIKILWKDGAIERLYRLRCLDNARPQSLFHNILLLEPITEDLRKEIEAGKESATTVSNAGPVNDGAISDICKHMASSNVSQTEPTRSLASRATF